jgi:hypothetical protein
LSRLGLAPLFALTLALGLSAREARAQNPAAAEALFEQARAAMAAGSYDIACARFRDSDKLDPAVGTRFNLADCEERRGHVATAWSLFRGVVSELADDDDRKPIAAKRAKALEPRMPYLTLVRAVDTPPGVRVRVDGVELGEGSFGVALPMDPGPHELVLLLGGGNADRKSGFSLSEGERTELPLRVTPAAAPIAGGDEPESLGQPGAWKRKWAFVAGGIGAGGVAVGAVTGIITLTKKSTVNANCSDNERACNQIGIDARESGRTFGVLSGISFGVGAVGLATGAFLWLTAPPPDENTHSSLPVRRALNGELARGYSAAVTASPSFAFDCATGTGFLAVSGGF